MTKEEVLARIEETGIIPAVRGHSAEEALFACQAVADGGIPVVELTTTVPGVIDVIASLAKSHPELIVGAGTVWKLDTARRCVDAGAKFLTSTGLALPIVEFAVKEKVAMLPGAMTPTEVMSAWMAGADLVKVFPCSQLGGPAYIKVLRAPFPEIPLVASGGVSQQNASAFIHAGASALGIGTDLIPEAAVRGRRPDLIYELARRFTVMVKDARTQSRWQPRLRPI
jgi:2-dehydro-3-deoxyphosphogluconate aldolase/(4S)-4-hydroxy-2-oxoglutarate aldolase